MKKWFLDMKVTTFAWGLIGAMVFAVGFMIYTESVVHERRLDSIAATSETEARRQRAEEEATDRRQQAEKKHQWEACLSQHGVPVMGYGYRVVCVDEEHVREIDGRKY